MDVLNRTTKQFLASVNEPDYPQVDWIWGPDLSAVVGWESRYWTISGDGVTLMSPAERAAVDAAALEAARDAAVSRLDAVEDLIRALAHTMLDGLNLVRSQCPHPISTITRSGTTATVTTQVAHGLTTGDTVTVLGSDATAYRGTKTVTVTGASTFTYTGVTGSPTTPAAGTLYYLQGVPAPTPQWTVAQLRAAIRARFGT